MRELRVELGERSYPIYIGAGILPDLAQVCRKHGLGVKSPLLIVTDERVAPHYLPQIEACLQAGGYRTATAVVAAGERSKSLAVFEEVITTALEAGLDRNSAVLALGGGVVGDLAGYVAASYMRGIRYVQIPTTIQAHDSSVGGKVAVNHRLAKNMIGAFHQPEFVYYDTATLRTLPDREVRAGLAEVLKEGLIWDRGFVEWFGAHSEQLLALDEDALEHALHEGCKIKALVVSKDERENDLRAILNLGHTLGHALEAVSGYNELLHGEAISIGMVAAAKLAEQLGYGSHIHEVTRGLLLRLGMPVVVPPQLDTGRIMEAMMHDKKFADGRMVYIVPTDIGQVEINKNVAPEQIRRIIDEMKGE